MNEGWFKIHRCLFKKAIWLNSTAQQKVILITLLGMANHEGKEWEWNGKQFKAEAGQFVTSANSIMSKSGIDVSRQNVRTALTKFKKYDFLTYESTKTGILVIIVNWRAYQGEKTIVNQVVNQPPTNISPTTNQSLTTNKNDKNDKNVKNDNKYIYIREFTQNRQLMETIIDFMKMRAEIKKPMTDRALQLMLNKLKGLSHDEEIQIKMLENSIENCWQGIFPLRDSNKGIFKVTEKDHGGFPVNERNHREFSAKEGNNGSFIQNTGDSEKKFNVKIPKWEVNAGGTGWEVNTRDGSGADGPSGQAGKTGGTNRADETYGTDGTSDGTGGQDSKPKAGYGKTTAKDEPF